MKYSRLGDTGLIVSRLAFGAATFGEGTGAMASMYKVNQSEANKLVDTALDLGVNYFNTADAYNSGHSEHMLRAAIGARRAQVVIATKVGNRTGDGYLDQGLSRRHIIAGAEASLRRLGTDWIDVYLLHRIDPYTPLEETLDALQQLVVSGKVRYIGFSNWPAWLAAKAVGIQCANGWERFRTAEMYYSLLGRDLEHEVIPFIIDAGIGLQVWSPLGGGFLSGSYTREDPTGGGGRLVGFDIVKFDRERGYDIVDVLKAIAADYDAKPSQVALAWLLQRPGVSSILVGASRTEQLIENLAAIDLQLSPTHLQVLGEISSSPLPYPNWFMAKFFDQTTRDALAEIS